MQTHFCKHPSLDLNVTLVTLSLLNGTHAARVSCKPAPIIEEPTAKTVPFGLDRCCWGAAADLRSAGWQKNNVSRLRESSLEVFAHAAQADIADDKSDQSITSFLHGFSGQLMQPTLYQQIDVLEETCI